MPHWKDSSIETFHSDTRPSTVLDCEVVINEGRIAISYDDVKFGPVTYSGGERGAGHFEVAANVGGGRGSLHKFEDGGRLDGFWVEDGYQGMWAISLK